MSIENLLLRATCYVFFHVIHMNKTERIRSEYLITYSNTSNDFVKYWRED